MAGLQPLLRALDQALGVSYALARDVVVDPAGKVTYRATDPSADQITTALRDAGAA